MLLSSLQENLITLLAFDAERAPIIRGVIDLSLYGGPYRTIAARIYDYLDSFKKPPGDHLPDILSDKLEAKTSEAALYENIVHSIYAAKDGINAEYAMATLETYVKRQSLRTIAVDLQKALVKDTEASLDEAEKLLLSANKQSLSIFDPGTRLSDKKRTLKFLDLNSAAYPTGIPELDKRSLGPSRKELWLLIANAKAGKSWALGQLAKMALMHRLKVVHITLEMSEARSAQRYLQALFAVAKRKEPFTVTKFRKDTLGRITGFDDIKMTPGLTLDDPHIRKKLERRIDRWALRLLDNIYIKEFPTSNLTVAQLRAYLDNLEATEKFVPDLLIVDYPDLMKLDKDNYRLALDETLKELRGIAVARNIALAAVSQSNRSGAKSKQVGVENVAEAWSNRAPMNACVSLCFCTHATMIGSSRRRDAGTSSIPTERACARSEGVDPAFLPAATHGIDSSAVRRMVCRLWMPLPRVTRSTATPCQPASRLYLEIARSCAGQRLPYFSHRA